MRFVQTFLKTTFCGKDLKRPSGLTSKSFLVADSSNMLITSTGTSRPSNASNSNALTKETYADKCLCVGRSNSSRDVTGALACSLKDALNNSFPGVLRLGYFSDGANLS